MTNEELEKMAYAIYNNTDPSEESRGTVIRIFEALLTVRDSVVTLPSEEEIREQCKMNAQLICDQSKGAFNSTEGMSDLLYSLVDGFLRRFRSQLTTSISSLVQLPSEKEVNSEILHHWREQEELVLKTQRLERELAVYKEALELISKHDAPRIFSAGAGSSKYWIKKRVPTKQAKQAIEALIKGAEIAEGK